VKQQPGRQNDGQSCGDQVLTPNSSDTSTNRGSQDQILMEISCEQLILLISCLLSNTVEIKRKTITNPEH
jgi:hypothetical protein